MGRPPPRPGGRGRRGIKPGVGGGGRALMGAEHEARGLGRAAPNVEEAREPGHGMGECGGRLTPSSHFSTTTYTTPVSIASTVRVTRRCSPGAHGPLRGLGISLFIYICTNAFDCTATTKL